MDASDQNNTGPQFPFALRALNAVGDGLSKLGIQPINLQLEALLQKASKKTGLSDFGGDEFRDPLQSLLRSLESEADLTLFGRMVARSDISRTLENRLGMVNLLREHPEIEQGRIERPIFVVGPPRTGTTIFHDLLALDSGNRVPLSWEASYPLPPPETATYLTDPRIARVQADLDQVDQLLPAFKSMHPMGAQRAQECVSITSHDFSSMVYQTQYDVSEYDRWLLDTDMQSPLQWHRRFLQILQWKAPGERWALKSPQHLWHIQHVLREYPDALIVQTHRDPVRVLVSISSLVATLRSLASDAVDLHKVARYYAMALAKGYNNTVEFRRSGQLPEGQVVDLYFQDFIRDQVGTVRRAYEHFGLELSEDAAAAMQHFLDENPADKHGKHLYSFVDIGMEEDEVREMFSEYESYFNVPREPVTQ